MRWMGWVGCVLVLTGCVTSHPAKPPTSQAFTPAQVVADPAPPIQIVEIPHPIPMPNQLKPLPELSLPERRLSPQESVTQANRSARWEPTSSGFINAMQVWPYSEAALYQVYTMPGKVTDITLEAGEEITDISAPDTVRWIVGDTKSGSGVEERRHVIVKPTRPDLACNLAIFTNRRAYHLELKSTPETWMAAVSWQYPQEHLDQLKKVNATREAAQPVASGVALERLDFRYTLKGEKTPWRPVRVFDDHEKVYIQFPDTISQTELPPLFVLSSKGDAELVNYHVRAPYYIVDRLFTVAELRLGGKHAEVVRIERTDLKARRGADTRDESGPP
jgi:type IV secretion system protein TrbG